MVDTASDGKEFGFRDCNIDHMVESFDHRFVVYINVCYRCCDIVLDTGISYHESNGQGVGGFNSKGIELLNARFE